MASSSSSSSFLVFFLIFCVLITILSESKATHAEQQLLMTLKLPLTHSLSNSQFTSSHHLLKTTATRSAARHRRLRHHRHHQVSLPLSPGSDYTLSFSLGTHPPQTLSIYMDTGSDLVWFPCSPFQCILCDGKYPPSSSAAALTPLLNISSSTRVPCDSPSCSAAHSSLPSSDLCAISACPLASIETSDCGKFFSCPPFYYAYGDGSLVARLHSNSLKMLSGSGDPLVLRNFTFGCAHSALAEPVGVAGFGRGVLSLPAQLAHFSPELGNRFSYCLVSHSFDSTKLRQPSPLILGRAAGSGGGGYQAGGVGGEVVYTPMLDNPKYPYFYSVGLEAVSVGGRRIPAPEGLRRVDRYGNGGVVVDSGTTFTMLPSALFNSVVEELDRRVGRIYKRATDIEERTGLTPCYYSSTDGGGASVGGVGMVMPSLALHFSGSNGNGSDAVVLPRRNYFYEFIDGGDGVEKGKKVGCLMLMNSGDEAEDDDGGPGATLGNYQQQGFEVVYDLEKRRVGFARRRCTALWDSLNRR